MRRACSQRRAGCRSRTPRGTRFRCPRRLTAKTLAFNQTAPGRHADIWTLSLDGGDPRPLVQGPFDDAAATFSPDSTMVAFQSAESGRWEIYVVRVCATDAG